MKRYVLSVCLLVATAALAPAGRAAAQGVTSAAVVGRLTDETGAPVDQAIVSLHNTSNGQRYQTRSASDGRYSFENVQVGGPYTLEARALGFSPQQVMGITLTLGQRLVRDVSLKRAAVEVSGITVSGVVNPLLSPSRTGAQSFVSESALANLPTLGRNFTDFIQTVPQVVSASVPGATIGGQNNRFNNIQIDGGVNNDLFGLAASGTPGGQANAHPISVEAVREYQVLIAPFDVRQGSFAGGLVNAVTKSGTNQYHGSAWGFLQNQSLVGKNLSGVSATDFHQNQYGFTASGPILRDRLQFFTSVDIQSRAAPFIGQLIRTDTTGGVDSTGVGIRSTTAGRVREIIQSQYGFDPGGFSAPNIDNPDKNIFAKLNFEPAANSHVELSYNYVNSTQDNLIRNSTATGFRDGYQLANSGYLFSTKTNTLRGRWTAQAGRNSNELLVGYQRIRDSRDLPNRVPLIFVGGDRTFTGFIPSTNIAAGSDRFSQANSLDQDIYELTNNFTIPSGKHLITIGTHNEFFHFFNVFFPASLGVWSFRDTSALKAGTPFRYEIALPLRPAGPNADFHVAQLGAYLQDQFSPDARLTLSFGLRMDVPIMDRPAFNNALAVSVLKVDTRNSPTGNFLWSPRVGFNYDLTGDGLSRLRGGVGIFSGRPPYVWVSNAFGNTGLEQATLICDGAVSGGTTDTVPTRFRVDPNDQPKSCGNEGPGSQSVSTAGAASIVYFDRDFRFPQNLKVSLGLDHQLPQGIVGTFDFMFTKSINQFYMTDVNLSGIQGTVAGENNRQLYGTINTTTGGTTPVRPSSAFRDVLRHRNKNADRALQITGQLQKRVGGGVQFNVGYTYSHIEDLISLTSSIANSNFRFTPLDGTLSDRNLRTSVFDIPHKITASGTFGIPLGFRASLIYVGQSGHPFTYVTQSDVNGDGVGGNDPVYVPRNASDISLLNASDWTTLDTYIKSESCLEKNRGHILTRNDCYNPWLNILNARFTKVLPTTNGQRVELSADVFNLLHLINHDWGVLRETSVFEEQNLLNTAGWDAVNQRFVYRLAVPQRARPTTQQWRVQVSLKYIF